MDKYTSPKWKEKRDFILSRDNYTCQNCNTFDPSLGQVEILNSMDGGIEFHNYDKITNTYSIDLSQKGLKVEIIFTPGMWINMPVLQVHHRRYFENRDIWDYNDIELITMCKECHTNYHIKNPIQYYDYIGSNLLKTEFTVVKDFGTGRNNDFKSWILINKDNKEYSVSKIVKPSLSYFVFENEFQQLNDIRKIALEAVKDFFKKYLPDYQISYN